MGLSFCTPGVCAYDNARPRGLSNGGRLPPEQARDGDSLLAGDRVQQVQAVPLGVDRRVAQLAHRPVHRPGTRGFVGQKEGRVGISLLRDL